jgi:hypothetical protein
MKEEYKDLLVLIGVILGIILIRYFWKKTPILGGGSSSNEERWKIIRNKDGVIQELVVYRNVKG